MIENIAAVFIYVNLCDACVFIIECGGGPNFRLTASFPISGCTLSNVTQIFSHETFVKPEYKTSSEITSIQPLHLSCFIRSCVPVDVFCLMAIILSRKATR